MHQLARRRFAGVDEEVHSERCGLVAQQRVLDSGDPAGDAEASPGVRSEHVDGIAARHSDQEVGEVETGLFEHRRARSVAVDDERIDLVLHLSGPRTIRLHDDNVLAFRGEPFGERGADGTGPDDDDPHLPPTTRRS